jgi:hypothetical protein
MKCEHEWWVYSSSICPPTIMVYCKTCDATGYIKEYTSAEWDACFNAPEHNYRWKGKGKVLGICEADI